MGVPSCFFFVSETEAVSSSVRGKVGCEKMNLQKDVCGTF